MQTLNDESIRHWHSRWGIAKQRSFDALLQMLGSACGAAAGHCKSNLGCAVAHLQADQVLLMHL